MSQRLPIGPVTSPHAVRLRRRPLATRPTRWHALLALAGAAAAVVGALFALSTPAVTVRMSASDYEIGGNRLLSRGPGVYEGPGGVLVMASGPGSSRAAASTTLNGTHMTGRCTLPPAGDRESCQFVLGDQHLSALDTRGASGWHRRYDDGQTVDIDFPGKAAVPVPFAVGRV